MQRGNVEVGSKAQGAVQGEVFQVSCHGASSVCMVLGGEECGERDLKQGHSTIWE